MDIQAVLKALSDGTRFKIVELLLRKNCCVRAISKRLDISEPAVSQHIKILKEIGLLEGEKRGYHMHYSVKRDMLRELAGEIEGLADIEREPEPIQNCGHKHGQGARKQHRRGRCK